MASTVGRNPRSPSRHKQGGEGGIDNAVIVGKVIGSDGTGRLGVRIHARFLGGNALNNSSCRPDARRSRARLVLVVAALVFIPGAATAQAPAGASPASLATTVVHPMDWPKGQWPLRPDAALEQRVQALLAKLTVEEKVGQIVQADIGSITPEDVRKYRLGSILAGGNSAPNGNEFSPPKDWLALADAFYAASMDASDGHTPVPILFGVDAVHGHNNVVGATLFPHNIGLGATRNPELIGRIARATALELRATGVEWTFAPTLTVPRDDRWGRTYEGYSEDPAIVASYAAQMVEGLQGKAGAQGLPGRCARHRLGQAFPRRRRHLRRQGPGRYPRDAKRNCATCTARRTRWRSQAGVQTVMASFSVLERREDAWQQGSAHRRAERPPGLRRFRRRRLERPRPGRGLHQRRLRRVLQRRRRHADGAGQLERLLRQRAAPGEVRRDTRWRGSTTPCARILRVKLRLGLFEACRRRSACSAASSTCSAAPAHRAIARQAVRESLVLLKNQGGVLAARSDASACWWPAIGADNVAKQSGGWTLTWQGTGTKRRTFPGARSIWAGIEAAGRRRGWQARPVRGRHVHARSPMSRSSCSVKNPTPNSRATFPTCITRPGEDADLDVLKKLRGRRHSRWSRCSCPVGRCG